jgi:hypothetical protein
MIWTALVVWIIERMNRKSKDLCSFWYLGHLFSIQCICDFTTWISIPHESLESLESCQCIYDSEILWFSWICDLDAFPELDRTTDVSLSDISLEASTSIFCESKYPWTLKFWKSSSKRMNHSGSLSFNSYCSCWLFWSSIYHSFTLRILPGAPRRYNPRGLLRQGVWVPMRGV